MSNEREKLERIERTIDEYCRWLAPEFPEVVLVLENLKAIASGTQSLCASHPPSAQGPWSTASLREVLRSRRPAPLLRSDINHLRDAISWVRGIRPAGNEPNHAITLEHLQSMLARLVSPPATGGCGGVVFHSGAGGRGPDGDAGQLPAGRPHP